VTCALLLWRTEQYLSHRRRCLLAARRGTYRSAPAEHLPVPCGALSLRGEACVWDVCLCFCVVTEFVTNSSPAWFVPLGVPSCPVCDTHEPARSPSHCFRLSFFLALISSLCSCRCVAASPTQPRRDHGGQPLAEEDRPGARLRVAHAHPEPSDSCQGDCPAPPCCCSGHPRVVVLAVVVIWRRRWWPGAGASACSCPRFCRQFPAVVFDAVVFARMVFRCVPRPPSLSLLVHTPNNIRKRAGSWFRP